MKIGLEREQPPQTLDNSTIREHWHRAAVFTDSWEGKEGTAVPTDKLLPGELSAMLFQVGCFTVRSAQRVYQIHEPGYSPEKETPATPKEVALVRKVMSRDKNPLPSIMPLLGLGPVCPVGSPWQNKLRITHEISARHQDNPDSPFTVLCRAAQSRNFAWSEQITTVLLAKKHLAMPDKSASLFVCNLYAGSSFSSETWYKLSPDGEIKILSLHPFDPDMNKARFHQGNCLS